MRISYRTKRNGNICTFVPHDEEIYDGNLLCRQSLVKLAKKWLSNYSMPILSFFSFPILSEQTK